MLGEVDTDMPSAVTGYADDASRLALRGAAGTSTSLIEQERRLRTRTDLDYPDMRAATNRCDGCACVSPTSRDHRLPGVGFVCVDCLSLSRSPYCPTDWHNDGGWPVTPSGPGWTP